MICDNILADVFGTTKRVRLILLLHVCFRFGGLCLTWLRMRACCRLSCSSWFSSSLWDSALTLPWWASPADGPTSSESMSSDGICRRRGFSLDFDMSCGTQTEIQINLFPFRKHIHKLAWRFTSWTNKKLKMRFQNLILIACQIKYECSLDEACKINQISTLTTNI